MKTWIWIVLLVLTAVVFYLAGIVDERARNRDSAQYTVSVHCPANNQHHPAATSER